MVLAHSQGQISPEWNKFEAKNGVLMYFEVATIKCVPPFVLVGFVRVYHQVAL